MNDLIIIGAGGVGKETALLVDQINQAVPTWNLLGFLDDSIQLHNTYVNGCKVLGGINTIFNFNNVYTVCAISNFEIKREIVDIVKKSKAKFANIIHPSVYISPSNQIGYDDIIYPGVIMSTNITMGNHVIISPKCGIGHETLIQDYSSLLWNVNVSGNVTIGEGVMMGSGSTIIQNRSIGKGAVVGAGATVIHDLPPYCTAVGVPARVIKINERLT